MSTLKSAAVLLAFCVTSAWAQQAGHHKAITAADLKWAPVPSLPRGAMISVIEGPMNQAVPFTVRLRLPADYRIPPHTHPAVERVTVLSGIFHMGMGPKFDRAVTQAIGPGDMMIMQAGTEHFAWTQGDVVLQLHGTGPWDITYVNAADDPRKQ